VAAAGAKAMQQQQGRGVGVTQHLPVTLKALPLPELGFAPVG
jgi:hypothetical protein